MKILLLITSLTLLFSPKARAQQPIPEGSVIAIVDVSNQYLFPCEGCQELKDSDFYFTIMAKGDVTKDVIPKDAYFTVEYQDGKVRLKTFYDTYISICRDCQLSGPNYVLIANERANGSNKVSDDALFDFINIEPSCSYLIVTSHTDAGQQDYYVNSHINSENQRNIIRSLSKTRVAGDDVYQRRTSRFQLRYKDKPFHKPQFRTRKFTSFEQLSELNFLNFQDDLGDKINYWMYSMSDAQKAFFLFVEDRDLRGDEQLSLNVKEDFRLLDINKFEFTYIAYFQAYRVAIYNYTGRFPKWHYLQPVVSSDEGGEVCSYNQRGTEVVASPKFPNSISDYWVLEADISGKGYLLRNRQSELYIGLKNDRTVLVSVSEALRFNFEGPRQDGGILPKAYTDFNLDPILSLPGPLGGNVVDPEEMNEYTWVGYLLKYDIPTYENKGFSDWEMPPREKAEEIFRALLKAYPDRNWWGTFWVAPTMDDKGNITDLNYVSVSDGDVTSMSYSWEAHLEGTETPWMCYPLIWRKD